MSINNRSTRVLGLVWAPILMCATSYATEIDHCAVPIAMQAYDKYDSNTQQSMLVSIQTELCEANYESASEAHRTAANRGLNVGFKAFSLGASEATSGGSEKYNVNQSEFCRASALDLKQKYASSSTSQIANIAVKAWKDCVTSSKLNRLFLQYETKFENTILTGHLVTTANETTLVQQLTAIDIIGPGKEDVTCQIAGRQFTNSTQFAEPIPLTSTSSIFSCSRVAGGKDVSIGIQTSVGAPQYADFPTFETLTNTEVEALEASYTKLVEEIIPNLERGLEKRLIDTAESTQRKFDNDLSTALGKAHQDMLDTLLDYVKLGETMAIVSLRNDGALYDQMGDNRGDNVTITTFKDGLNNRFKIVRWE